MGTLKFAPCVFGIAAAVVFGTNPIGVQAAPVTTTKYDVSFDPPIANWSIFNFPIIIPFSSLICSTQFALKTAS